MSDASPAPRPPATSLPADAPRLLVVEDDQQVLRGLVSGLHRAGFRVDVAMDGTTAEERLMSPVDGDYDAVLLDLMLPGQSGFDVLEALRGRRSTPVIVLSALTELPARLQSFELGAVDFVPKPFWIEELVLRLRTRLRLGAPQSRNTRTLGEVVLDLDARTASRDGVDLGLTAHEYNLLAWLVERPGRAVSRAQLVAHTLSGEAGASERAVDPHISRLRKKLGPEGSCIRTVWGIGYRCDPPETP